jgi:hypothetical protein
METRQMVVTFGVIVFQVLALAAARRHPRLDAVGATVLEYGWPLRALGFFVGLVSPVLILALAYWQVPQTGEEFIAFCLVLSSAAIGGGFVLLEATRTRVVVSELGIRHISPWRRTRFVRWTDIQDVSFSPINGCFVIVGANAERIRAPLYLKGIPFLARMIQEKIPSKLRVNAADALKNRIGSTSSFDAVREAVAPIEDYDGLRTHHT